MSVPQIDDLASKFFARAATAPRGPTATAAVARATASQACGRLFLMMSVAPVDYPTVGEFRSAAQEALARSATHPPIPTQRAVGGYAPNVRREHRRAPGDLRSSRRRDGGGGRRRRRVPSTLRPRHLPPVTRSACSGTRAVSRSSSARHEVGEPFSVELRFVSPRSRRRMRDGAPLLCRHARVYDRSSVANEDHAVKRTEIRVSRARGGSTLRAPCSPAPRSVGGIRIVRRPPSRPRRGSGSRSRSAWPIRARS